MTLRRLLKLCSDAASQRAGFTEHYDFAGEVGPEPVLLLLIQREELMGSIRKVLESQKFRADSPTLLILREALERAEQGWEKDPVDPPPFSL
jgi:hypothetical protein